MPLPALGPPSSLDPTAPLGSAAVSEGDDWIRYLLNVLKTYFPGIAGIMSSSHTELNYSVGVTSAIQTQLNAKASNAALAAVAVGNLALVLETATAVTGVVGTEHALTNAAASTVTLPASPTAGNIVAASATNGLLTNVVARNGNNIMGLAQDMTINIAYASVSLRYVNATVGWEIL